MKPLKSFVKSRTLRSILFKLDDVRVRALREKLKQDGFKTRAEWFRALVDRYLGER